MYLSYIEWIIYIIFILYMSITLGNKMKQVGCCMGYFNWFHSIKGQRYLNENHFCPIRSRFPAILGFCGDFWRFLKNFHNFFHSVCVFYCTQHDRLDLTVSTQKSVWKTNHPGLRYLRKTNIGWRFGLACPIKKHFCKYLGPGWLVFQTDFCVETVISRRSFWVQ